MQNIDTSALAAAKAKLDAAEAQREEVLLRHIANGVDIRSRNVEIGSEVVIAPGADGGNGVSSFTQVDFLPSWQPTAFHLKEVQTVVPNVLWVRYTRP